MDTSITFLRETLLTALNAVEPAVPRRPLKEIYGHVLLEFSPAGCFLCANDGELQIRHPVLGDTKDSGSLILPNRIRPILTEFRTEKITLEVNADIVVVRADSSEFKLPFIPASEFPAVPAFNAKDLISIPSQVMKQAIRRTIFCTDPESTRYALAGIQLLIENGALVFAATDSRRLAVVHIPCTVTGIVDLAAKTIIPQKAMAMLDRIIGDSEESVSLAVTGHTASFEIGGSTLATRLLEGRFPNWKDVIPTSNRVEACFVASPFFAALRQVMVITSEESRGIDFRFMENNLRLEGQTADIGSAKIETTIQYGGQPLLISFDPRFICDFLKVLGPETSLKLQMTDAESAGLLTLTDQGNYQYVIMPLSRDR